MTEYKFVGVFDVRVSHPSEVIGKFIQIDSKEFIKVLSVEYTANDICKFHYQNGEYFNASRVGYKIYEPANELTWSDLQFKNKTFTVDGVDGYKLFNIIYHKDFTYCQFSGGPLQQIIAKRIFPDQHSNIYINEGVEA